TAEFKMPDGGQVGEGLVDHAEIPSLNDHAHEGGRTGSRYRPERDQRSGVGHWDHSVGSRSQRCDRSSARSSSVSPPASLVARLARTWATLRIPGITVSISGLLRMKRRAISGRVMPGGRTFFSASARATL